MAYSKIATGNASDTVKKFGDFMFPSLLWYFIENSQ